MRAYKSSVTLARYTDTLWSRPFKLHPVPLAIPVDPWMTDCFYEKLSLQLSLDTGDVPGGLTWRALRQSGKKLYRMEADESTWLV